MLNILGKPASINVRKVLWTCAELALPHQLEAWGTGSLSLQSPQFLALNPGGLVPVIDDDGFILSESNSICRYLADRHGGGRLLPPPSRERALVERWMDWQATELNNSWRYAFMALVRHSPLHQDASLLDEGIAAWQHNMGLLERHLAGAGPYMTGATFTLADVVIGLSVNRWKATPLPHAALPAVDAYFARLSQRPAFREHGNNGLA
ncbi:glutathione S-transferase family protein [Massilia sp. DWR3-1-1]|uniref:glutathione S-transferase family protein n=1 Tax=Massilia sp. DWR3-1-1 TaxID=2804559 RepID=UPI003CF8A80C